MADAGQAILETIRIESRPLWAERQLLTGAVIQIDQHALVLTACNGHKRCRVDQSRGPTATAGSWLHRSGLGQPK
jgi:hypothetical protein